jgi:hypothetical protein
MADLGFSFTYSEDDLKDDFAPIPDGTYDVEVMDTDVKAKPETGSKFISTTLRIVEGEYEGRRLFVNITVDSPNPKALAMGRKLLASLCNAIGMPVGFQLENSSDLHNVPVKAVVYTQEAKNGYPERNAVRTFKKIDDVAAAPPAPKVEAKPAAPWKR